MCRQRTVLNENMCICYKWKIKLTVGGTGFRIEFECILKNNQNVSQTFARGIALYSCQSSDGMARAGLTIRNLDKSTIYRHVAYM